MITDEKMVDILKTAVKNAMIETIDQAVDRFFSKVREAMAVPAELIPKEPEKFAACGCPKIHSQGSPGVLYMIKHTSDCPANPKNNLIA